MKKAFSMIELVFVIVVMGILGKFGVEYFVLLYKRYIYSDQLLEMSSQTENISFFIEKRLQYRLKDSVVIKKDGACYELGSEEIKSIDLTKDFTLEWIGVDIEGFRGYWNGSMYTPTWSGLVDDVNNTHLHTPETNTTSANETIQALSNNNSSFNDGAIVFLDQDVYDPCVSFGYKNFDENNLSIIPVEASASGIDIIEGNFTDKKRTIWYKYAWSASAIEHNSTTKELKFYTSYQPWNNGENYKNDASIVAIIAQNIPTFMLDGNNTSAGDVFNQYIEANITMTKTLFDENQSVSKNILVE
jgi:hypothetical protein